MTRFITDEMAAAAGMELDRLVSFPIDASDVRRWALAVYHPDEPPAAFLGPAPTEVPAEFNPFAWIVAEPAGGRPGYVPDSPSIEARLGLPEVETDFMLNGGTEIRYDHPMRVGDTITATTALDGYHEREGRHGTMLFTLTTVTWTNQDDELVKAATNTLIRY